MKVIINSEMAAKNLANSSAANLGHIRDFYRSIIDGRQPQYFLNRLATFRSYSDELPNSRVDLLHPHFPLMKCRANVIYVIYMALSSLVDQGLVSDNGVLLLIKNFQLRKFGYAQRIKGIMNRTTPEDIKFINDTLDGVINYLHNEYGLEKPVIDFNSILGEKRNEYIKSRNEHSEAK